MGLEKQLNAVKSLTGCLHRSLKATSDESDVDYRGQAPKVSERIMG